MAKKRGQQKKKKRTGRSRRSRGVGSLKGSMSRMSMNPSMKNMAVMESMGICSITNPFCPEAVNARWPDNSFTKSVGYSVGGRIFAISTDTANAANLFCGDVYAYSNSTNASPKSSPFTYTTILAPVTLPTGIARYRVTSWGLRIKSLVAPLSAQGMVRVRLFSPMTGVPLSSIDGSTVLCDAQHDVPLARLLNKDLFIVPMPLGENARLFRDYTTATGTLANWINPGWQVVQVAVEGGPASTACIEIQAYYHYEFVFNDADASNAYAQTAPLENTVTQNGGASVLSSIGNFVEGTVQKVDALFQSRAFQYVIGLGASLATKNPAPLLLTAAGGGGGSKQRYIRDVD